MKYKKDVILMRERSAFIINGLLGVFILLILLAATGISLFMEEFIFAGIFLLIAITIGSGITLVQPNQSIVVIFFGKYMGSIRKEGLDRKSTRLNSSHVA